MDRNLYRISFRNYLLSFWFLLSTTSLVFSQLDYRYYNKSCPKLTSIVRNGVFTAIRNDSRMAASLLRLHFHDCIVNGCDASLLLDDTDSVKGEKNALPNQNSVRGYEVIDSIKAALETACPSTVSCADIITLASIYSVQMSGGPIINISLGRRDGIIASQSAANAQVPSPFEPLENITAKFTSKGLDIKDVAVLSGAHTIGFSQCSLFKSRLFDHNGSGKPDPALETTLLQSLQNICPNQDSSDTNLAPLDSVTTKRFDSVYYNNLVNGSAVLQSDQALMADNTTAAMVINYSKYPLAFYRDFKTSIVKMSNLGVLTGSDGQIRKNCRVVN